MAVQARDQQVDRIRAEIRGRADGPAARSPRVPPRAASVPTSARRIGGRRGRGGCVVVRGLAVVEVERRRVAVFGLAALDRLAVDAGLAAALAALVGAAVASAAVDVAGVDFGGRRLGRARSPGCRRLGGARLGRARPCRPPWPRSTRGGRARRLGAADWPRATRGVDLVAVVFAAAGFAVEVAARRVVGARFVVARRLVVGDLVVFGAGVVVALRPDLALPPARPEPTPPRPHSVPLPPSRSLAWAPPAWRPAVASSAWPRSSSVVVRAAGARVARRGAAAAAAARRRPTSGTRHVLGRVAPGPAS